MHTKLIRLKGTSLSRLQIIWLYFSTPCLIFRKLLAHNSHSLCAVAKSTLAFLVLTLILQLRPILPIANLIEFFFSVLCPFFQHLGKAYDPVYSLQFASQIEKSRERTKKLCDLSNFRSLFQPHNVVGNNWHVHSLSASLTFLR